MSYIKAVLDIQLFATEDVITTSNPAVVEVPYGGDEIKDPTILPAQPPEPAGNANPNGQVI